MKDIRSHDHHAMHCNAAPTCIKHQPPTHEKPLNDMHATHSTFPRTRFARYIRISDGPLRDGLCLVMHII
jgi:hypothetical protein